MYRFFAFLLALLAVNNIAVIGLGVPLAAYYASFGLVFIIGVVREKPIFDGKMTLFIIAIIFSVIGNSIPEYFRAEERFISFLLIILMLSPWFFNSALAELRSYLFKYTNLLLLVIVILSVLGNITGVFPGLGRANLFQGLTSHSMLLGPFAAIVMLIALWQSTQANLKRKVLVLSVVLVLLCLYAILLTGSRGALIGGGIAGVVLLFMVFKRNFNKVIKLSVIVVVLLVATVSYWSAYTANIERKNQYGKNEGDNFASRTDLWAYRYDEFTQSPVIGIGFASANKGAINKTNGQIEPGTSWGVLFAQLGVFGAVPLILIFLAYFKELRGREDDLNTGKLLFALLLFFTIHMVVEGYILASGNFMFFYVWLLLGIINNRNKEQEVIIY